MNPLDVEGTSSSRAVDSNITNMNTRLSGSWLLVARVTWIVVVTLMVVLCLAMLPAYDSLLQTICIAARCALVQPTLEASQGIDKLGLSLSTYATVTLALTLASLLLGLAVSAVIFWRKSEDWMALLVAMSVVALGTLYVTYVIQSTSSAWQVLAIVLNVLGNGLFFLVCMLFPNGRFVPRWTPWLLPCLVGAGMLFLLFRAVAVAYLVYNVVWLAAVGVLVVALFYRYRYVSSPLERQQTKWVIYGGSLAGILVIGLTVPLFLVPSLGHAGSFYQAAIAPAYLLAVLLVQLCTGLAILRYRLYDIDLLINRTLVYGSLSAVLVGLYVGLILALQALVAVLTGSLSQQQPVVIVTSTLVIAALFQPLRRRLQTIIDRRFYRHKYDAAKVVAAFTGTLRNEVDLNQLSKDLITVVQETMQPSHVSLWLRQPSPRATPSLQIGKPSAEEPETREKIAGPGI